MSDLRFKPIGGMFQGVRGSTSVSSGENDAKKLVLLNDRGEIDDSCLNPGLRDAGSLRTDIDREVTNRQIGDNELAQAVEDLSESLDTRAAELGARIDALSETVSENKDDADAKMTAANSRIDENERRILDHDDTISGIVSDISSLSGRVSSIESSISELNSKVLENSARMDGIESDMGVMSDKLDRNNELLEEVSASLAAVSSTILSLATKMTEMEQDVDRLDTDIGVVRTTQSTFDARLSTIEDILAGLINQGQGENP